MKDELVLNNLKLADYIANKYGFFNEYVDMEDVKQEAYLGLCEAAEKYDKERNVKFSTFAYNYIVGNVVTYLKKNGVSQLSLDEAIMTDEDEITYKDLIVDEKQNTEDICIKVDLERAINECLNENEKYIIEHYYGLNGLKPQTLKEIGKNLGKWPQNVETAKKVALGKLKDWFNK